MKAIQTSQAPKAIGCYSQAVQIDNLIFLSGQIAIDPATQQMVEGGIQAELEQVFKNMQAIIFAANATLNDVAKLTVFLKNMADFKLVNESMQQYFKSPYPARSVVQVVELPKSALVEIEAIVLVSL